MPHHTYQVRLLRGLVKLQGLVVVEKGERQQRESPVRVVMTGEEVRLFCCCNIGAYPTHFSGAEPSRAGRDDRE